MREHGKLVLTGLAALLGGMAAATAWRAARAPDEAVSPAAEARADKERAAELARAADVPPEIERTRRYLEERWGHLGERGLAALSTESNGDVIVIDPEPKAGVNGKGERIWALGYYRARKWTGDVVHYGDGVGQPGATVPLSALGARAAPPQPAPKDD